MVNESILQLEFDLSWTSILARASLMLISITLMLGAINAQSIPSPQPAESPYIVDGVTEGMAYAVGHSLKITGTVRNGAIALGGDVIVQGTVEGDVAAIGGSVIQLEGSRIGGDVMVLGGTYRHADATPNRNPGAMTVMYAGYEQQLRNIMRNPKDLLAPHWSAAYIGFRVLAIL